MKEFEDYTEDAGNGIRKIINLQVFIDALRSDTELMDRIDSAKYVPPTLENPFNIEPGGFCPVQASGNLPTGEYYYFRARWSSATLDICESESKWHNSEYIRCYGPEDCGGEYGGSWLEHAEAIKMVTAWIMDYYTNPKRHNP